MFPAIISLLGINYYFMSPLRHITHLSQCNQIKHLESRKQTAQPGELANGAFI